MDNLPAHKLASIEPMIESVGAKVLCLSPYSPDFNPIELWWSQLKSFLRTFSPTTTEMVDKVISVALDLMNPQHLKNWFTSAVIVPHNIGICCINLPRRSAACEDVRAHISLVLGTTS